MADPSRDSRAETFLDDTVLVIDAVAGDEGIDDPDTTMHERSLPAPQMIEEVDPDA